jgi:hypothetical protein
MRLSKTALASVAVLAAGTLMSAPSQADTAGCDGCTTSFVPTGTTQTYTVPGSVTVDGQAIPVTRVYLEVAGAAGGNVDQSSGGSGGITTGVVPVTPGETISVVVGDDGGDGGGGGGGRAFLYNGGSGGGGSFVLDATNAASPNLLMASGGGSGSAAGTASNGSDGQGALSVATSPTDGQDFQIPTAGTGGDGSGYGGGGGGGGFTAGGGGQGDDNGNLTYASPGDPGTGFAESGTTYLTVANDTNPSSNGYVRITPLGDRFYQDLPFTAPPKNPAIGDSYTVHAISEAGTPVVYTVDSFSQSCTLDGDVVTYVAKGGCIIDATAGANYQYLKTTTTQSTNVAIHPGKPKLKGTAAVGRTLKASTGTWSPASLTFTYKWYANKAVIKGAKSSSYTLTAAQAHKKVYVAVTGSAVGYSPVTADSAPTGTVAK